jgi:hypothetical protein
MLLVVREAGIAVSASVMSTVRGWERSALRMNVYGVALVSR